VKDEIVEPKLGTIGDRQIIVNLNWGQANNGKRGIQIE
jgi:hypothetical protein